MGKKKVLALKAVRWAVEDRAITQISKLFGNKNRKNKLLLPIIEQGYTGAN